MFTSNFNLREIEESIDKISKFNIKENEEILTKTGEELKKVSEDCFIRSVSPDGKRWKPLMKSTLRNKRTRISILRINDKLRNSVKYETSKGSVKIGTSLTYGALHQNGCKASNLVARPFLGINNDAIENIKKIAEKAFFREIQK